MNGGERGTTVWKGSALSDHCDSNEIALLHRRFRDTNGTFGECNNGAITGRSIGVENNGSLYISQLEYVVGPEMIEENIVCIYDSTTSEPESVVGLIYINASVCSNASENLNNSTLHIVTLKGTHSQNTS